MEKKLLYRTLTLQLSQYLAWVSFLFLLTLPVISSAQVFLNEYSAANLSQYPDNYGEYEDWVELYNAGPTAVSLSGYYLSDDAAVPTKWLIPAGATIQAGGFLVFWCSGRDEGNFGNYHTNFKIAQTKNLAEILLFSDPSGTLLDSDTIGITQLGHSRGRAVNGTGAWEYYTAPSPGASNNPMPSYSRYADRPSIDSSAGFYNGAITVSITTTEPASTIRYTLDGTGVTQFSPAYTGPISITATKVLKARTFSSNPLILPGFINFKTFFINENHVLPVVSVSGTDLTNLLAGNGALEPHGSFEYFDETKKRKAEGYGEMNKHGNDSWAYNQRGFDWVTRDEMGYAQHLKEKFFPGCDRNKFQRLILRPEGNDNYNGAYNGIGAHLRDMYCHRLSELAGLHVDVRKSEKCIVYVDGDYRGVYSIREKVDDPDYTEYYYSQNKYNLQVIKTWGATWAEYGGAQALTDWNNLHNFIMFNNMAIPANYQQAADQLDMMSLIDYFLLNSFVVNADWLNWNTGWWRGLDTTAGHHKWGYLLWDQDNTFGHGINYTGVPTQLPTADPCAPEALTGASDPEGHAEMLTALRANPDFDQLYLSRYSDLLNTAFNCDSMLAVLDSITNHFGPEMNRHAINWGGTYLQWDANVTTLRNWLLSRCAAIPQGMVGCYGLDGPYELVFNVDPPASGGIKVNTLTFTTFERRGMYYGGIPITMQAIETDTNYTFSHWELFVHQVQPNAFIPNVSLGISGADSIVAHFIPDSLVTGDLSFEPTPGLAKIRVYPNPFNESTTVLVAGQVKAGYLEVCDVFGKPVARYEPSDLNLFEIERAGLAAGVYMIRAFDNKGHLIGNGKIIALD